jgi:hypothetical protein
MFGSGTQLFQYELTTSMAQVYPASGVPRLEVPLEIVLLVIANTTGSAVTFNLCYDDDGTAHAAGSALYWEKSIAANDSFVFQAQGPGTGIPISKTGSLGLQASATGLTATFYVVPAAIGGQVEGATDVRSV